MDGVSFKDLPVLIVASETQAREKLKACFLTSNTANTRITVSEAFSEALSQYLSSGENYAAIITHIPAFSGEAMAFVEAVSRNKNGPVIVITDCNNTVKACREQGHNFILRETGLDQDTFLSLVPAAWENFSLNESVKKLEDVCHLTEKRFQDVADNFTDWLWEVDASLNIIFSSSRKRPAKEAEAGARFTACFLPDERTKVEDDFAELTSNPKAFHDVEYWSFDAYGTRICWSLSGVPVFDKGEKVVGFRGIGRDISKEKASVDQIYSLANNDPLTTLYNRNRFHEEIRRMIRRAKRNDEEFVLIAVNIDRFKYVNEIHGHETGDKLLVHVSQILKENVRAGDLVARIGNDEFAILLPNVQGSEVEYRANNIITLLNSNPFEINNTSISISASIGIARYPAHGRSVDELLSHVDIALHDAKDNGRNRIEQYDEEKTQQNNVSQRLQTLDFVSKCLENGPDKIMLHFQPIVPLNSDDPTPRYEVLARLVTPEGGLLEACDFIEIAEEFGLIAQLDKYISSRAIELLRKWHAAGKRISLSVNISGRTFDNESIVKEISEQLSQAGLPKHALIFEITETAVLRDLEKVRNAITELRRHGAAFALDDCGVGYSSFNYIKQLELDFIKIDGTFIRHLNQENNKDEAFVRALHDVAQRMKILTVGESVENIETAEQLRKIGIDFGQGYYFGKPVPNVDDDTLH